MPKLSTYPTLFDECKVIRIADLKKLGYLNPSQYRTGVLTWSSNGNKTGSIAVKVDTITASPFIELDYKANGKPVNYRIRLVSIPANIGKGHVWFFICPRTGKRCRKLHFVDTYFYHRSAWRGCYYEKQIQSKRWRDMDKSILGRTFKAESIFEKIYKKNFKSSYNGKPTKNFLKLLQKMKKIDESAFMEILENFNYVCR